MFYVNLDYFNNDPAYRAQPAEMSLRYNRPILSDPTRYQVALEKGAFPLDELPLIDLQELKLTILADRDGFESTELNIMTYFESGNENPGDLRVYEIQRVLDALNMALRDVFTQVGDVTKAYIFRFNSGSELFSCLLPADGWDNVSIYVSHDLYNLFRGLTFKRNVSSNNLTHPRAWKFQPFSSSGIITYPTVNVWKDDAFKLYFEVLASHSSLSEWSDFDTLILTSQSLPIRSEVCSTFDNTVSETTVDAITTLSLNAANVLSSRGDVLLSPNYRRFIDLLSSGPISNIDIKVWVRNKRGIVTPLMMSKGAHISVTLVFKPRE